MNNNYYLGIWIFHKLQFKHKKMEPLKSTFRKLTFHSSKHKSLDASIDNQMDFEIFALKS